MMGTSKLGRAEVGGGAAGELADPEPSCLWEGRLLPTPCPHTHSGPAQKSPDMGLLKVWVFSLWVQREEPGKGIGGNWLWGGVNENRSSLGWSFQKELHLELREPEVGAGAHPLWASESERGQSTWMRALCSLRTTCCGCCCRMDVLGAPWHT